MGTGLGASTVLLGRSHHEVKRSSSDNRRSNKPIMEKRRRARINNCLNDLKGMLLDATKKDPARHAKLEKADILEKTVRYVHDLQRQNMAIMLAADPIHLNKFVAGFSECLKEVERFSGVEPVSKRRLLQHLSNFINLGAKNASTAADAMQSGDSNTHIQPAPTNTLQPVQIHVLPSSPPGSPESTNSNSQQHHHIAHQQIHQHQHQHHHHQQQQHQHQQQSLTKLNSTNNNMNYNSYYAYAHPHLHAHPSGHNASSALNAPAQMPSLVPIPVRTAAVAALHSASSAIASSATSTNSSSNGQHYTPPSPANSYGTLDSTLVMPVDDDEDIIDDDEDDDIHDDDDDDDVSECDDGDDDDNEAEEDEEAEAYARQPAARRRRLNCGGSSSVSDGSVTSSSSSSSNSGSTSSSASSNSSLSGAMLEEELDDQRSSCSVNSGPLALVVKRSASAMDEDEERPWRPW